MLSCASEHGQLRGCRLLSPSSRSDQRPIVSSSPDGELTLRQRIPTQACLVLAVLTALACGPASSGPDHLAPQNTSQPVSGEMNFEARAGSESVAALAAKPAGSRIQSIESEHAARVYYQFIDQRGSVRFVERLDDVPAEWRDRVGFVEMDSPPPLSPIDSQRTRGAHHAAASKARVVLYFADWCPYCARARKHLDRRGVAYDLRDVDIPSVAQELLAKAGSRSIPVIEIGGRVVRGYNAGRLDEMLEGAGLL